jgi:hypothetical protein
MADNFIELYESFDSGWFKTGQPRSEQTTTPTTMAQFAREVFAPATLAQPTDSSKE